MKRASPMAIACLVAISTFSCAQSETSGTGGRISIVVGAHDGRCLQELSADWEYYPGLFMKSGVDFSNSEATARRTLLEFRDNGQRKEAWKRFHPYEGFDYGTFRLIVDFSDPRPKDLLIRVPFFDMAVELYIQGESRYSNGVVGASGEASRPRSYHPAIIEASSITDRLEITLSIANYHFPLWGTRDYLVIGDADSLTRYIIRQTYVEAMLVGALVIMALANLILVVLAQDRRSPLYLLFLSLAAVLLNLSNGSAVLGLLGLEWEAMNRLTYLAISMEFLFMGIYLLHQMVADERRSHVAKLVYATASMPFFALIAAAPVSVFSLSYHIHAAIIVSVMAWSLIAAAWRGVKGDLRHAFLALTILLLLLFYCIDSIQLVRINRYSYFSLYGVALFSVLNIGMLAWRIRGFSTELERQVKERTHELVRERERVEDKVRDAVREIQEKDDLISLQSRQAATGEMIDFIAHQWKQSLYAISLHSEMLRSRIRQDGVVGMDFAKKPLDTIQLVMDEMVRGMDVLRNFTSPRRQAERFDLASTAEDTIALLRDMFSVKRVGLRLEAEPGIIVHGSSQELKQVIINLLVNAQEAINREPGRRGMVVVGVWTETPPTVSTANPDGEFAVGGADGRVPARNSIAVLEVKDDGGGIPVGIVATVFDKFTSDKPKGGGLGLYFSRMIVERHFCGAIQARNEGGGAVFTVRLPALTP